MFLEIPKNQVPLLTLLFIPIICYLNSLQDCLGVEENSPLIKLNQLIAPVDAYPQEIFLKSESIKRIRAMEQLDELIFHAIE